MCELLGMSANAALDLRFSWRAFRRRGGGNGPHRDGFGVGVYRDDGYHDFHDLSPAAESPLADFLANTIVPATTLLGHIRQANEGSIELQNTYPFTREMGGRLWCYAMQGQLAGYEALPLSGRFTPQGSTDGEHAFCWLLDRLSEIDRSDSAAVAALMDVCGERLAGMGVFNALLSDGRTLYAYASKPMHWLTRRAPFGVANALDSGERLDLAVHCDEANVHTLIVTQPLTDEPCWQVMPANRAVAFRAGERLTRDVHETFSRG
ncbi:class II glutamine amidotransferase [Salinicola aestuarinus]|uniref:class II glutamine amidotransferase n=1 Tax=Salinicola aestuarinus TaxID=1949082 RepID=UPI001300AED5|nr:class II glutamine amidotransferase [Salinicola aestuarinus]